MKLLSKLTENEIKRYIKLASIISYILIIADIAVIMFLCFTLIDEFELEKFSLHLILYCVVVSILVILILLDTCNRIVVIKNLKRLCSDYKNTEDEKHKEQILYTLKGFVIIHQLDELRRILEKNEKGPDYV